MRGIHFGSQVTHLEESTKTNHPLNRTLVILLTEKEKGPNNSNKKSKT